MFTQEANVEAMYLATKLLYGDEAAMMLAKVADTIDAAMKRGYELGLQQGQMNLEAACDASFDAGWQHGEQFGEAESALDDAEISSEAYDDGYLQGVQDARANPALADDCVQDIISVRAWDFYDQFDAG